MTATPTQGNELVELVASLQRFADARDHNPNVIMHLSAENAGKLASLIAELTRERDEAQGQLEAEPLLTGRGWENLSCDDQFMLAKQVAGNVGYLLVPEPSISAEEDADDDRAKAEAARSQKGVDRAWRDIADERKRQIAIEGWTAEHDAQHDNGEMLRAGVFYLWYGSGSVGDVEGRCAYRDDGAPVGWPWDAKWWKPKDRHSNLVRAGALFLAQRDLYVRTGKLTGPADHKIGLALRELSALSPDTISDVMPEAGQSVRDNEWRDDLASDERWNEGVNYAITRLCSILDVDPKAISWDAATETLDGDVSAVICHVLVAAYGEEWAPALPDEGVREIEALLARITPGEWDFEQTDFGMADMLVFARTTENKSGRVPIARVAPQAGDANAAFIARAPEIVRTLLAYIRQLESGSVTDASAARVERLTQEQATAKAGSKAGSKVATDGGWFPMSTAPNDRKIGCIWHDIYSGTGDDAKCTAGHTFWNQDHWANKPSSHWEPIAWCDFPVFVGVGPPIGKDAALSEVVRERDALREALTKIIAADDDFRDSLLPGWERDALTLACDAAKLLLPARSTSGGSSGA